MKITTFETEEYFAQYEFNTPYLLSVSDCESLTIRELMQISERAPDHLLDIWLGYTESQGNPELRQSIAATYQEVNANQVIILTSPIEGIYLSMRAILEPGDDVIVLTPAYDALINLAKHISNHVTNWTIVETSSGWQLDFNFLESALSSRTKAIVVNFPHNPSGLLPSVADFHRLFEFADRYGTWVFCDEMYRGLEFGIGQKLPSAVDIYERSIVLSGLSKTHGLPGLRAGWLVIPNNELRHEVMNWKNYTSICPVAPVEALMSVALSATDKIVGRNSAIIAYNIQLANGFFQRWSDLFAWRMPQAGSVALVGIDVPSATSYCHLLAKEAGVLLLPAPFMGYDDHHVRFGFGRLSFPAALAAYEIYLQNNV